MLAPSCATTHDIILIGEIRDSETADIAVRSSLTGHLVLSTLHTNDAPSAVTRLTDMGVEPYLIASCVEGIVAQRLVRRVCTQCARPDDLTPEIREDILACYPNLAGQAKFVMGNGCPNCGFTATAGAARSRGPGHREIPSAKACCAPRAAKRHQRSSRSRGRHAAPRGWLRVIEGRTSVEEVLRRRQGRV